MPETFLKDLSMDGMDGMDGMDAESPATSGWVTPTLFGNAEEAKQYYAVHGPPCQLWDGLPLQAVLQQKAVQRDGEDTPTNLGTFEQSQRLWEASGCPIPEPQLLPPEIERVVNFVAQRESLRAQHQQQQQLLLALEPLVADQTAEEPAEEAAEVAEEVDEQALEHVDYQQTPEAGEVKTENLEAPKAETAAAVSVVESVPSPDSELLRARCGPARDNLNTNAPKFRPGMEECPYVAIGQLCRTSKFCGFGRCKSYLEVQILLQVLPLCAAAGPMRLCQ